MNNFFKEIKNKLNDSIKIENILIIDNSVKHKSHKFYNKKKYHLKLEIQSNELKALSLLEAHRKIYKILKDNFKGKIHALELEIK